MDKCGTKEGFLIIFNRDPEVSWEEKIFDRDEEYKGLNIKVFGM